MKTRGQLGNDIARLKLAHEELLQFDATTLTEQFDPRVRMLEDKVKRLLREAFAGRDEELRAYALAGHLIDGVISLGGDGMHPIEVRGRFGRNRDKAEKYLAGAIARLKELADSAPSEVKDKASPNASTRPIRAFIIHGHDEAAKEKVARFLEMIGIEAIILDEHASRGKTIIEKFEEKSLAVGYAIALFTPDDEGRRKGTDRLDDRARQNVVLEAGYFIGSLGRTKVCAMTRGNVEMPSDLHGIVHIALDKADWDKRLGKELNAAGFKVDWNAYLEKS